MGSQRIQGCTGSSVARRNQKPSRLSPTTCALSSNRTTPCLKRALKRSSSQVSRHSAPPPRSLPSDTAVTAVLSSLRPQIKTSAPRRTAAVNTSVSIPSEATVAIAGVALCFMRTNTTVKKVRSKVSSNVRCLAAAHECVVCAEPVGFVFFFFYSWL